MNEQTIEPGAVLRYTGKSHGMHGWIIKIIGPILDEGGQPTGRYEVQPWVAKEGRYSWVVCDATAAELEPAPDAPPEALTRDDPTYTLWTIDPSAPGAERLLGDPDEAC